LHIGIEEGEIESLFRHLDKRNDGEISYSEFIKVFA
jgi:Ca2+-binding EF-hand superfamily protein